MSDVVILNMLKSRQRSHAKVALQLSDIQLRISKATPELAKVLLPVERGYKARLAQLDEETKALELELKRLAANDPQVELPGAGKAPSAPSKRS